MIRVLIVDDHELLRAACAAGSSAKTGSRSSARPTRPSGPSSWRARLQPDLILLDLLLPAEEAATSDPGAHAGRAQAKILVVSSQAAPSSVRRALSAGAAGYLPKRSSDRELLAAIRLVAEAAATSSPSSARGSSRRAAHRRSSRSPSESATSAICSHLAYTNQEIGKKLFISVRTVDTHRAHIMRKLQLETVPSS
jgi:DNA-binding NarL/FixJ family response regulator